MISDGLPFHDQEKPELMLTNPLFTDGTASSLNAVWQTSFEFNDTAVKFLPLVTSEKWISDIHDPCLFLRIRPDANPTYYFKNILAHRYNDPPAKILIGSTSNWSVDDARLKSKLLQSNSFQEKIPKARIRRTLPIRKLIDIFCSGRNPNHNRGMPSIEHTDRQRRLLTDHVAGRFGDKPPHKIKRKDWFLHLELLQVRQPKTFEKVHSITVTFLNWCCHHQLIEGNPLARTRAKYIPDRFPNRLELVDVIKIYDACTEIGSVAGQIAKLSILTGQTRKTVMEAQAESVDLGGSQWLVGAKNTYYGQLQGGKPLSLCSEALTLMDTGSKWGFIFQSHRGGQIKSLSTEFNQKVKELARIGWDWNAHDLNKAVNGGIRSLRHCDDPAAVWCRIFFEKWREIHDPNDSLEDVVL